MNRRTLIAIGALSSAACAHLFAGPRTLRAELQPMPGQKATGTITFSESGHHIVVAGEVRGLTPGEHGFHIHEKGDCSAPDGSSAGDHFNPGWQSHGKEGSQEYHRGGMPNLVADEIGVARYRVELHDLTLDSGPSAIEGLAVLVHAGPDDYTTQPSGNAGPPVACGVIR